MNEKILSQQLRAMIDEVSGLCIRVEKGEPVDFTPIEEKVGELSREFNQINLSQETGVRETIMGLNNMLDNLWLGMKNLQDRIINQMDQLTVHQQALNAYSRVANSNANKLT